MRVPGIVDGYGTLPGGTSLQVQGERIYMENRTANSRRRRLQPLVMIACLVAAVSVIIPASVWPGAGHRGTAQASSSAAQVSRPQRTNTPSATKAIRAAALSDHGC